MYLKALKMVGEFSKAVMSNRKLLFWMKCNFKFTLIKVKLFILKRFIIYFFRVTQLSNIVFD